MSVQPPPPQGAYTPPPQGAYTPPPQGAYTPPPVGYAPQGYVPGPAPGIRYSSRLGRFIAYLVDGFVVGILLAIPYAIGFALIAAGANGDNGVVALLGSLILLIGVLVGIAYKPWMWSRGGQTIGYKVMHLKVLRASDGGPITGGQAVGRLLGYIVSGFFWLGFIWILFDEKRQGWHDKLAGTVVIEV